jgi:hypothetical protein
MANSTGNGANKNQPGNDAKELNLENVLIVYILPIAVEKLSFLTLINAVESGYIASKSESHTKK